MSVSSNAAADLRCERAEAQIAEAKELLRHKEKHQGEIDKINIRLGQLDADADPVDFDYKSIGDTIKIELGRQFCK